MFLGSPSGFVSSLVDKLIGGWEMDGPARIQGGANLNLSGGTLGNVNLVGMTAKDLQKAFKIRFDDANKFGSLLVTV